MYEYRAKITSVYDGDTVTADVDLGMFQTSRKVKLRLYGIDTPEIRRVSVAVKKKGIESRDWVREKISEKEVIIKTYKDKKGKYGRWLAEIWIEGDSLSINDQLVELGLAVYKDY